MSAEHDSIWVADEPSPEALAGAGAKRRKKAHKKGGPNESSASSSSQPPIGAAINDDNDDGDEPKLRRAYRACAHCRMRKTKCDLGDIDAPREPPCTRCKREGVECVFLPSRRGGRFSVAKRDARARELALMIEEAKRLESKTGEASSRQSTSLEPQQSHSSSLQPDRRISSAQVSTINWASESLSMHDMAAPPTSFAFEPPPPPASAPTGAFSSVFAPPAAMTSRAPPTASPASHNSPATSAASGRPEGSSISSRGRRRRGASIGAVLDTDEIASSGLRNPVDALKLLATAADNGKENTEGEEARLGKRATSPTSGAPPSAVEQQEPAEHGVDSSASDFSQHWAPSSLDFYPLVANKVLNAASIGRLLSHFFARMHAAIPIVPVHKIPDFYDEPSLARFVYEEGPLATSLLTIASRYDKDYDMEHHSKIWAYMQTLIADIIMGKQASISGVEALLILSEYLPKQHVTSAVDLSAEENQMSWMLVGNAVRLGYFLGLDQKSMSANTTGDRERIAWTYCYLFDRQGAIRNGSAFWSRGPGLCFTLGAKTHAPDLFPSLAHQENPFQDDFATALQAFVELTTIMSATHDCLYPSEDRTSTLSESGAYYKYVDDLSRTLASFRATWEDKRWTNLLTTDCLWMSYHYLRVYIYAFPFQSSIRRSAAHGDNAIFHRGVMSSPDVKFILEGIRAAVDLIKIAVDILYVRQVLAHVPWRYFTYLSYASVYLIKALAVSAVVEQDRPGIILLLKKLMACIATSSSDEQHPGVRYARFLSSLLKVVVKPGEAVTTVPTPAQSPRPSNANPPDTVTQHIGELFPPLPHAGPSTSVAPRPTDGGLTTQWPGSDMFPVGAGEPFAPDVFDWDRLDLTLGMDDTTTSVAPDALSYLLNKNAIDSLWQSFGYSGSE